MNVNSTIIVCKYKGPRKSERTWQPAAKYSIRNRGHQRSSLYGVDILRFQDPRVAQSTMYQQMR